MSDYATVEILTSQSKFFTSKILNDYRLGNLTYNTVMNPSPLIDIYAQTYKYLPTQESVYSLKKVLNKK